MLSYYFLFDRVSRTFGFIDKHLWLKSDKTPTRGVRLWARNTPVVWFLQRRVRSMLADLGKLSVHLRSLTAKTPHLRVSSDLCTQKDHCNYKVDHDGMVARRLDKNFSEVGLEAL